MHRGLHRVPSTEHLGLHRGLHRDRSECNREECLRRATLPGGGAQDIYLVYELMDTDLHQIVRSRQDLTEQHLQWFVYQARRRRRPARTCAATQGAPPPDGPQAGALCRTTTL